MATTKTFRATSLGGYRVKLLTLFLCALPLFAEGGIQGVPPWPNQTGAELLTNGDMENMTGWTLSTCGAQDAGTGVGGSNSLLINGNCTVNRLFTSPDADLYPWVIVTLKIQRPTGDYELRVQLRDQTEGGDFAQVNSSFDTELIQTDMPTEGVVIAGGDYIELWRVFAMSANHGSESFKLELVSVNGTTGTLHVDDVSVKGANYPLYNFVKYPTNKGYLWSGYDSWLCDGATADEACGFVDVRPPTGTTIAQTYVEIHHDTTAGCASPTATVTVQPTVQRTAWEADLSGVADDATVYVCAQLRLDSDNSLIADFRDWKIIKRTTAWRTSNLDHWIDDYGRWIDGTTPRFMWMSYLRFSGENCSTCVWSGGSAEANYLSIEGFGGRSIWNDYQRSARNLALYFSPFSGANPDVATDQFSPFSDAMDTLGLRWWNISTQYFGELLGYDELEDGDEAPTAPSLGSASSGGSVADAFVYVKVSAVGGRNSLENFRSLVESEASTSAHVSLTGSTNTVTVTPPACSGAQIGHWVYAEGVGTESEPANATYSLQTTKFVDCGDSVTLTAIIDSQKEPLTASMGSGAGQIADPITSRPSWMTTNETFKTVFDEIETQLAGAESLLGYYLGDEVVPYDAGWAYAMQDYLRVNYPGRVNMSVVLQAGAYAGVDWFFSPILDVNGQDIYYEGQSLTDDVQAHNGSTTGRSVTCYAYAGNNATASYNNGNLNKIDTWVDDKMRSHDGSRFNLPVVQQWTRSSTTCAGWTLDEMRKQLWKAVIGVQNWGMIGGVGTWGWVSVSGTLRYGVTPADQNVDNSPSGEPRGNTRLLEDDVRAGTEMMALERELLEPVDDSTQLGFGTVLDGAPTSSISLPTATCTLLGSPVPIRTVAKEMDNGDQWIFATNLCPDTQTMTFSLADATGKIATDYITGATYTITTGDFSVSSTDFGVHVIKVETPKGGGIQGR